MTLHHRLPALLQLRGFAMARRLVSTFVVACALPMALVTGPASAQIEISGQLDLVATPHRDSLGINSAFRGDNPYNPVRLRLYARHWVTERIGIFTELFYDADASPRVNGAYVVVNELAGRDWLSARLGLAPNVIGGFGLRSTYFNSNPVIGVPLVWQYRTNLGSSGTDTAASLVTTTGEPGAGMPMLYDSCWNVQWELLGEAGSFEYSLALTPGALSSPIKARDVGGSQWLARLGWIPLPGLRLGASGGVGPYLSQPIADGTGQLPYAGDPGSYDQTLVGVDLEYAQGPWLLYAEGYHNRWEAPLVADDLEVTGGYVEARFDFLPGWYAAGRAGALLFGDVTVGPAPGTAVSWDQDTYRTEAAVGYRLAREVLVKLNWQRTTTAETDFEQNLFAVQLSAVF